MNHALIMSGGRSQRMRAGGCETHKALRTVNGQSLIERNLLKVSNSGFETVWVAVNSQESAILLWLANQGKQIASASDFELRILLESEPLGTIGAASLIPDYVDDLLVLNVDNLTTVDLRQMMNVHSANRACMSIAVHDERFQIPFGQIRSTGGMLESYTEKPCIPITISSGIYVLAPGARRYLPGRARIDVPALVERLRSSEETVFCFHHDSSWIDINDEEALARANGHFHSFAMSSSL